MPLQLIHWVVKGFVQCQIALLGIPEQQPLVFQLLADAVGNDMCQL